MVLLQMGDITNPKLMYLKGALFLVGGLLAGVVLVMENPTVKTALLVLLVAWCFARAYYFAFYVVSRYIDPAYRFSGLWSFACYLFRRRRSSHGGPSA